MQRRHHTPNRPIAHQTRQRKRKEIAHEQRSRSLTQDQGEGHASGYGGHFSRDLLPWRERDDLHGGSIGDLLGGGRRRGGPRGCGHDGALVRDDGAAHDFVFEIDAEVVVLRGHGEQQFGDVVGVER